MDTLTPDERAKIVAALEQHVDDLERKLETSGAVVDERHSAWQQARSIHHAVSEALNLTVSALQKINNPGGEPL